MAIRSYLEYTPSIGDRVFIDPSAVVTGRVSIGVDCSIWPHVSVRGDVHDISIGERSNIQDGSVLHTTSPESHAPDGFPLVLGSDITVGHRVILHGCTVGDRVLVGMGAILMDGVTVESDVVIAAGSLVSPGKTLESGSLYVGAPAKRVRDLRAEELDFLKYSAAHYVKLKNLHINNSAPLT